MLDWLWDALLVLLLGVAAGVVLKLAIIATWRIADLHEPDEDAGDDGSAA